MQTTKRNIFSIMLLLVVIFNLTSTTLFLHSHLLNERIIVHSHPFTSNPDSHSHSASSLEIIARQTITEASIAQIFTPNNRVEFSVIPYGCDIVDKVASCGIVQSSLRAPPQLV